MKSLAVIPEKPAPGLESRPLVNRRDAGTGRSGVDSFTTRDKAVRSELRLAVEALRTHLETWRSHLIPMPN